MFKQISICECGSNEFITKPNAYDVYQIIDDQIGFVGQEHLEENDLLYCRGCGKVQDFELA